MGSRFLQLPGELRNRIYEYALTEPRGLLYREDDNGIGWLCLSSQDVQLIVKGTHVSSEVGKDKDGDEPARKRHKITASDRSCTPKKAITIHRRVVNIGGYKVANQIQFVNRQLRQETRGLVISYNDITFKGTMRSSEYEQFADFLCSCSIRQQARISMLMLEPCQDDAVHLPNPLSPLLIALAFCKSHLNAKVKIRTSTLDQEHPAFLLRAAILEVISHGTMDLVTRISGGDDEVETVFIEILKLRYKDLLDNASDEGRFPSNLRFFPLQMVFDVATFERSLNGCEVLREDILPRVHGGLDTWVTIAKEVFENGV